ncbi:aldose 1-epimerase [Paraliobacillus ryukyuensis]|uniref:Aldose 1-epimerase n=1 Tax=Paraliobacillus ryukyuensis TaxID=200904 RepID=A0A366EDE8_9BACI|nr:aldose epimerase family protein [Paraliobacillus ryukyuensis]RBP00434.1 aldose 1-epimerase [Paraliobacillus ryukyuensis]
MEIQEKEISVATQKWTEYTLINDQGMSVSCLNYGGIITSIYTPDKNDNFENVILSYANYEDYLENPNFFGALIGRVAGRIDQATFTLDGKTYSLPKNEGNNHLHGGTAGFHQVIWQTTPFQTNKAVGVRLVHVSPDGDGGYPGNIKMTVTYTLTNDNDFTITYKATTDQNTILTTTNHAYFNLSGSLKRDILNHEVMLHANEFVELDHELIPTGKILPVDDTVFDFRKAHPIIDGVHSVDQQNLVASNGYDHYFIFNQSEQPNAVVTDPESGRQVIVTTDQPGMVMYTSNGLDDSLQLRERSSAKYLGVCLETQASPASLEYEGFPSIRLNKDKTYHKTTTFSFRRS